jgi:hypothetical protein
MIKKITSQILESDNKERRWFCKANYKCQHYLQKSSRPKTFLDLLISLVQLDR